MTIPFCSLRRVAQCVAAIAIALSASIAMSQTVPLATGPLYSGAQVAPNVAVTLSVEWPTVGMAYYAGNTVPTVYSSSAVYAGYFDATKCYSYDTTTVLATTPSSTGFFRVFGPAGGTSAHDCGYGNFSGNFLNFATMSSIDEFRYAMTGGNRVVENGPNGGTIIERAYLPDGTVSAYGSFYAYAGGYPTVSSVPGSVPVSYTLYVNNCKTLVFFGVGATYNASCSNPDLLAGSIPFKVRVLVCDASEGPTRSDLCKQYGGTSGLYKPVGQAQINADTVRFAAFGYMLDRNVADYTIQPGACNNSGYNRCRYGGVLRSPMKYLGSATNASTWEVDSTSGTLRSNPDNNTATNGISGFINYINKFGQTGIYKAWDPMGEMYYEAIRYYQGLQPTPDAYTFPNGLSTAASSAIYDNFPVYTDWSAIPAISPTAVCSANYVVNLSDTNTNDDSYFPGYTGTPSDVPYRPSSRAVGTDGFNAIDWTRKVGVLESTTTPGLATAVEHPDVNPSLANLETLQTGYQGATYGSVGVAYWANTNDIRPDLPGKQTVRTINFDVNEAPSGNSPGVGKPAGTDIQKRALWLMGKYGYFSNTIDRAADGTQANPFYASDPSNAAGPAIRSNSEWEDAPGSAYPAGYLLASNPQKLIDSLRAAFTQIAASASGTAAGGSITSASINYGSAGTYIANFSPARWSGTVYYESVTASNGVLSVNSTPVWDAGALLTARCGTVAAASTVCEDTDSSINKRNIVTTIKVGTTRQAKPFTFTNVSLDTNYLLALNTTPNSSVGATDGLAQQRINYLRGYRFDEGSASGSSNFRVRDSVMGDIINSAPVYVGAPASGITDADYQTFFSSNVNRTAAVYVGANDGMLHGFNGATGAELFGYIPNFISSYLGDLTFTPYTHEPFVDAIPVVREAKVNGAWKTVLVSGTGAGGQGVFALDVTDPTAFDATKVLFEFSDADDPDLGNVLFAPEIVKLQTGTSSGAPTYGYFAAVTAYNNKRAQCRSPGVLGLFKTLLGPVNALLVPTCSGNSQADMAVSTTASNQGVLFLLSLDRTLGSAWQLNGNYYKYYFPASSATAVNALGPVSALLARNGSGAASALYFGDLQGDLWRFNTTGVQSAWTPSRGTVAAAQPIFTAVSSSNVIQPITAHPEIGFGPYGSTLVAFGTGEYLGSPDAVAPYAQQTQYLLIDSDGTSLISRTGNLTQRTASGAGPLTISGNGFVYYGTGSAKGWYLDFPGTGAGERMVNKAALSPGLLAFTSLTLASSVCGSGGGYIYQVDPLSGLPIGSGTGGVGGYASTVGIPGPPAIVTLATAPGASRATGENIGQQTKAVLVSGTSGQIAQPGVSVTQKAPPVGRISWREITNYNDQPRTP